MKSAHRVCGGVFKADPDVPADNQGRRTCVCHLVGEPGDAHHNPPAPGPDVQRLAAGESEES